MLTRLKLERFKNFKNAEIVLGPLTTLIGSNASGKSNIRDAFRFLHGVGRGYTLAEIMGEKYGEGGVLQWRGIRGGPREITYLQADTFTLTADFDSHLSPDGQISIIRYTVTYSIEVKPNIKNGKSKVIKEVLYVNDDMMFDSHPLRDPPEQRDAQHLVVRIPPGGKYRRGHVESFIAYQPVLTQIADRIAGQRRDRKASEIIRRVNETISELASMRFLDLTPDAMRLPSFPGQTTLGDRGENLSSVLQAIYEDSQQKKALIEWIRELTPMDASDFEFIPDQTGRILLNLVEENGQKTSAYSASDGTLRFLAMLAALLGPKPSRLPLLLGYKPTKLYFFEELDNGLHPARLYLLLQLIEQTTAKGNSQVITTTHSPQLLRFLSDQARKYASLVYRRPNTPEARIEGILDIPEAQRLAEQQDLARLHESGWFENAMFFLDDEDDTE